MKNAVYKIVTVGKVGVAKRVRMIMWQFSVKCYGMYGGDNYD